MRWSNLISIKVEGTKLCVHSDSTLSVVAWNQLRSFSKAVLFYTKMALLRPDLLFLHCTLAMWLN